MREIKFRALSNNVMVYGHYFNNHDFNNQDIIIGFDNDKINNEPTEFIINVNTLGQYTGLKDKDGKELFYDDIVKFNLKDNHELYNIPFRAMKDDFDVPVFVNDNIEHLLIEFKDFFMEMNRNDFKIIGNIHQNKELLK